MKIKPEKPRKLWGKKTKEGKDAKQDASVERVNRTVYITVAVLLIVLAVAVAATSAANKAKVETPPVTTVPDVTDAPPATDAPATQAPMPEQTEPPVTEDAGAEGTDEAVDVVEPLPTFILPTDDGILGNKHDPTVQVFSPTLNEWRVHLGVDIVTGEAAPVYAAADGVIKSVQDDPLLGMSVAVEHSGNCISVYKNLSDTLPDGVEVGARVSAGDLLGCVGDGAVLELADEPHLHFEVMVDGKAVDPLEYFSKNALSVLTSAEDEGYEG